MAYYAGPAAIADENFRHQCAPNGIVVRKPSHPRGQYGVWLAGGTLNVAIRIGEASLAVKGSRGRLTIVKYVPETLLAGAVGRRMEDLLGHPLLNGCDYRVVSASNDGDMAVFEFETGLVPFKAPLPGTEHRKSRATRTASGGSRRRSTGEA